MEWLFPERDLSMPEKRAIYSICCCVVIVLKYYHSFCCFLQSFPCAVPFNNRENFVNIFSWKEKWIVLRLKRDPTLSCEWSYKFFFLKLGCQITLFKSPSNPICIMTLSFSPPCQEFTSMASYSVLLQTTQYFRFWNRPSFSFYVNVISFTS